MEGPTRRFSAAAHVTFYPSLGGTGLLNETPIATIEGANSGLDGPGGIALDRVAKRRKAQ
jgi:hypothetical protein